MVQNMSRHLLASVFALVAASVACDCGGAAPEPGTRPDVGGEGEAEDGLDVVDAALLRAHNDARADVSPTPSPPLPPLTWSTDLAATAQSWAERCVFEHSSGNLGENLALFSPRDVDASLAASVVELWDSERVDYSLSSNSCAAGKQCGHYTQLVWRDTERVGCGVANCNNVDGFGAGNLWVCNYDPPGNYVGERPY